MKKIILKALLFFAILFAVLKSLDVFISTGLKKSQSFFFVDWNTIYSGHINADIIVNGNSKAWHHVSPKILDSICNMSSYNLGIDGYDFLALKYEYFINYNHPSLSYFTLLLNQKKNNDIEIKLSKNGFKIIVKPKDYVYNDLYFYYTYYPLYEKGVLKRCNNFSKQLIFFR